MARSPKTPICEICRKKPATTRSRPTAFGTLTWRCDGCLKRAKEPQKASRR